MFSPPDLIRYLHAIDEVERAVGVAHEDVAHVEPAAAEVVRVDLGRAPVAAEQRRAAHRTARRACRRARRGRRRRRAGPRRTGSAAWTAASGATPIGIRLDEQGGQPVSVAPKVFAYGAPSSARDRARSRPAAPDRPSRRTASRRAAAMPRARELVGEAADHAGHEQQPAERLASRRSRRAARRRSRRPRSPCRRPSACRASTRRRPCDRAATTRRRCRRAAMPNSARMTRLRTISRAVADAPRPSAGRWCRWCRG